MVVYLCEDLCVVFSDCDQVVKEHVEDDKRNSNVIHRKPKKEEYIIKV